MTNRSALVAVSAAQLAAGLAGLAVAVRRRRHFDIPFLRGHPDHVARDAWWAGTAYSAPAFMLATQAWATVRLTQGPDDAARRTLMWLGVVMTPGYLAERWSRVRLTPGRFDPLETPIVVTALSGAIALAVLARSGPATPAAPQVAGKVPRP